MPLWSKRKSFHTFLEAQLRKFGIQTKKLQAIVCDNTSFIVFDENTLMVQTGEAGIDCDDGLSLNGSEQVLHNGHNTYTWQTWTS